jgi:hypothetical protein
MRERRATWAELGIRWPYWASAEVSLAVGLAVFYLGSVNQADRGLNYFFGSFFGLISLLAVAAPLLRLREQQGAIYSPQPQRRLPHQGIFIPRSSAMTMIYLFGGILCFGVLLFIVLTTKHSRFRVKAGIGLAGYAFLGLHFLRSFSSRRPGIILTKDGIEWNEPMLAPCFIRWTRSRWRKRTGTRASILNPAPSV